MTTAEKIKAELEKLRQRSHINDHAMGDDYVDLSGSLDDAAQAALALLEAVVVAREGNALMAEGEGEDESVYMDMGHYHMDKLDEAVHKAAQILGLEFS